MKNFAWTFVLCIALIAPVSALAGDLGPMTDPNGLVPAGDLGPMIDPNGLVPAGDLGPMTDPNS